MIAPVQTHAGQSRAPARGAKQKGEEPAVEREVAEDRHDRQRPQFRADQRRQRGDPHAVGKDCRPLLATADVEVVGPTPA